MQYWIRKSASELFKVGKDMYTGDEDNGSMVRAVLCCQLYLVPRVLVCLLPGNSFQQDSLCARVGGDCWHVRRARAEFMVPPGFTGPLLSQAGKSFRTNTPPPRNVVL